ncbi:MAG: DUF5667 domain-containing protein [Chloroflexi bacterium]|nr:DUF5667 domain-containing protein [Chloroflexota bacterium]
MSQELQQILDDCIERLVSGESVEECLAAYPQHREELLPLLESAWRALNAAESIAVNTSAKSRGLYRLNQAITESATAEKPRPSRINIWRSRAAKPVGIGLAAMFLLVGLTSIAAVQSSDTVPGDEAYWIKTTKEKVLLWFPKSDADRAQMHARLAGERGNEMQVLMESGRFVEAERMLARVRYHLAESARQAGVVVSVNSIEMPRAPQRIRENQQLITLRITIQQNGDIVISRRTEIVRTMSPTQQQRAQQIMRDLDLAYRTMLASMDDDFSSLSSPFWRTESIGTTYIRDY